MKHIGSRLSRQDAREHARRAAEALRRQAAALEAAAADPEPVPAVAAAHRSAAMREWFGHLLPIVHENERRKAVAARAGRAA